MVREAEMNTRRGVTGAATEKRESKTQHEKRERAAGVAGKDEGRGDWGNEKTRKYRQGLRDAFFF